MSQKYSPSTIVLTVGAALVLIAGGYGFFRQLSRQSVNKENSFRAKLILLERLRDGRTALCNRDDKMALKNLKLRASTGDWFTVALEQPLAPARCSDSIRLNVPEAAELTHFSALWEGELEVRFEEVLPLTK